MRIYFFSIISILNSFIISRVGIIFFIDYFIKYGDIPNDANNAAGAGLAGVAVGVLFLILHILLHIFIFIIASKKRIQKIYLNKLLISRKNNLFSNVINGITYLIITYLIIVLYKGKLHINNTFFQFYILHGLIMYF